MLSNFVTIIRRPFSHLSTRLAARLLGPAARAGLIIADKDASLVAACGQDFLAASHGMPLSMRRSLTKLAL